MFHLGLAEDQHVVRRCGRLGSDGCADLLEQRVGLGKVDDSVDDDVDRRDAGPSDADGVAGRRMQVGGGLLCNQDSVVGADQGADGAGKLLAVVRGNTQYHCRAGCLGASTGLCDESGGVRVSDR